MPPFHSTNLTMFAALIVGASLIGIWPTPAEAASPHGLRGTGTAAPKAKAAPAASPAQAFLGRGIWRASACDRHENFQVFTFQAESKVEVGAGKPGDGERLELLRVGISTDGLFEVETRVCAPVGCNQTRERYKKLGETQIQEWHFEGRLPDHEPYVLVKDGQATDGSGPGRIFNRCLN